MPDYVRRGRTIQQITVALRIAPHRRLLGAEAQLGARWLPGELRQEQARARRWRGSRLGRDEALRERVLSELARGPSPQQVSRAGWRGDPDNGHQVALQEGTAITVTVTAADGSGSRVYRVRVALGAAPAPACLRGAGAGFTLVVSASGSLADVEDCARR